MSESARIWITLLISFERKQHIQLSTFRYSASFIFLQKGIKIFKELDLLATYGIFPEGPETVEPKRICANFKEKEKTLATARGAVKMFSSLQLIDRTFRALQDG